MISNEMYDHEKSTNSNKKILKGPVGSLLPYYLSYHLSSIPAVNISCGTSLDNY